MDSSIEMSHEEGCTHEGCQHVPGHEECSIHHMTHCMYIKPALITEFSVIAENRTYSDLKFIYFYEYQNILIKPPII